ncbi:tryptophan halogenase family protein [Phenylobacterium deserti]|uniref:Tryptophan 7-halogenase n=1 Tax=Phenylobacterium deserti TaxID=1914756 RepID=A0A328A8A6_9CAUL|nr:tryptophan halogenase family protein [Phenylobacterium deserti]RAK50833.1 tryptophan 7-halogenase [Phenylobacterium deserti]
MNDRRIQSLVIVGGGTAGWMAAARLAQHFRGTPLKITLVESSEIGTIGVGEATIPTIRSFYGALGLSDAEVMRATQATAKLGIRFTDWSRPGRSFIHPFGLFGHELNGIEFQHWWLRARSLGAAAELGEYSLGASLAAAGRFNLPPRNPPSPLAVFDWALHFDAGLFAQLMRRHAETLGVRRIDAKVRQVKLRPENGFIEGVELDSGETVTGELFIDCSGFRGLLIEEALGAGYEDWSQWLFCDRALAVQSESAGDPAPFTEVTAQPAGWRWKIPLQHRDGNGHVFSSRHMDEPTALRLLTGAVQGRLLHEPRAIRFHPGRRKLAWSRNCVALGLASGFLEPLESTSIALIETGIEKLRQLFPDRSMDPALRDEFNDWSRREMERTRDFIILHYKLNGRTDSDFWREAREMDVPDSLQHKIDLWRARGHFVRYRWEMFQPASWLAIYAGFECLPQVWDPGVDAVEPNSLRARLADMRQAIARAVASAPPHTQFLQQTARAEAAAVG